MNKQKSVHPSQTMNTITFEEHYLAMDREFAMKYRLVYALNGLVTLGCFIAFLFIDGRELVYTFYIPLDVFLNLSKTAFFFYQKLQDEIKN